MKRLLLLLLLAPYVGAWTLIPELSRNATAGAAFTDTSLEFFPFTSTENYSITYANNTYRHLLWNITLTTRMDLYASGVQAFMGSAAGDLSATRFEAEGGSLILTDAGNLGSPAEAGLQQESFDTDLNTNYSFSSYSITNGFYGDGNYFNKSSASLSIPTGPFTIEILSNSTSPGTLFRTDAFSLYQDNTNIYYAQGTPATWDNFTSTSGSGNIVYAMAEWNGSLYIAGDFTSIGGISANRIVRYNGNFTALSSGMNGIVYSLAVYNNTLYAGGSFTTSGGTTTNRIARWTGSTWQALDATPGIDNGIVYALAVFGTDLYVGGSFTTLNAVTYNRIARYNGTIFTPPFTTITTGAVQALYPGNTSLLIGGTFTTPNPYLFRYNGTSTLIAGTFNNNVYSIAAYRNLTIVSGDFTTPQTRIASTPYGNATTWAALGSGLDNDARSLIVWGDRLYAAGSFTTAGGLDASRIAMWNGTWNQIQPGTNGGGTTGDVIYALAAFRGEVYAGGSFTAISNISIPATRIARLTGNTGYFHTPTVQGLISLVHTDTNALLYSNGVLRINQTMPLLNATNLIFARDMGSKFAGTASNYYIGMMDELRYYNRSLTSEEIQAHTFGMYARFSDSQILNATVTLKVISATQRNLTIYTRNTTGLLTPCADIPVSPTPVEVTCTGNFGPLYEIVFAGAGRSPETSSYIDYLELEIEEPLTIHTEPFMLDAPASLAGNTFICKYCNLTTATFTISAPTAGEYESVHADIQSAALYGQLIPVTLTAAYESYTSNTALITITYRSSPEALPIDGNVTYTDHNSSFNIPYSNLTDDYRVTFTADNPFQDYYFNLTATAPGYEPASLTNQLIRVRNTTTTRICAWKDLNLTTPYQNGFAYVTATIPGLSCLPASPTCFFTGKYGNKGALEGWCADVMFWEIPLNYTIYFYAGDITFQTPYSDPDFSTEYFQFMLAQNRPISTSTARLDYYLPDYQTSNPRLYAPKDVSWLWIMLLVTLSFIIASALFRTPEGRTNNWAAIAVAVTVFILMLLYYSYNWSSVWDSTFGALPTFGGNNP